MSYAVEVWNDHGESRQAVALEKGYIDGKQVLRLTDGSCAVNVRGKLFEYDGERPIGMNGEPEEPAELTVPEKKVIGDQEGHVAGTENASWTDETAADDEPEAVDPETIDEVEGAELITVEPEKEDA